jgi:hypothetical protein
VDSTRINTLPVDNSENELIGALKMYALLRAGVI